MKIKFFKSNELEKPHRLAVHKSGKLGFTIEAAKALKLSQETSISIGMNEEDSTDQNLYMAVHSEVVEGAFKVAKAGEYYYLPIKLLLDNLKIPYAKESVVFNMTKVETSNDDLYRLTRLEKEEKKEKKPKEQEEEDFDDI
jgi:hypothetical protein